MNLNYVLLQAQQGGGGSMLVWLIIIFVVMWLLMLRPQQKQAKKEKEFRDKMKKGDRVSFSGGIYGKVHDVADHTVDIEIANGVVITVGKNMVQPMPEEQVKK